MADQFDPTAITRPDKKLLHYYLIVAILSGPALPILLPLLLFKYETLRYRFDDQGIAMTWGFLFRQEVYLTYRRIQDIHLTRGLIQRWLGLSTVTVQTASGSAMPVMAIEGILQSEELRDFLYSKMRGGHGPAERHDTASHRDTAATAARGGSESNASVALSGVADAGGAAPSETAAATADDAELLGLLREIRDDLRSLAARTEDRS